MQDNMIGQNIIITEQCSSLRQLGRNALRGKWGVAIIAVLIYNLCQLVPKLILDHLFGYNIWNVFTSDGFTYEMDPEFYTEVYNQMPQISILSAIYILLIAGALQLGLTIFFLATFRGHDVSPKDIFLGFERFGKALGLFLFQFLFIYLWSMLFIIPGIIASIRYSQAFYVLADDPEKSIRQCMNESKAMMRGNKAKYFLLGLSFLGWILLACIPGGCLDTIVRTVTTNSTVIEIVSMLTSLFMVPVYAYIYSTFTGFYEILAGHLIKETQPAPISAEEIEIAAPVEKIEEVIEKVEAKEAELAEEANVQTEEVPGEILDAEVIPPAEDSETEGNE